MKNDIKIEIWFHIFDYDIENSTMVTEISKLKNTTLKFQDIRYGAFLGGIFGIITIVSVTANIAVIADLLYKYFKKERANRLKLKINDEIIEVEGLSPDKMKKILLAYFDSGNGKKHQKKTKKKK